MLEAIKSADVAVLLFIQENMQCGLLDIVMVFFTKLGNGGAVWLISGLVLFITRKYRMAGFNIVIAVGICWGINEIFKDIIMRPRPFTEMEELIVLIDLPDSWAFPSGHACTAFAAAYAYARGVRKWGALAYIVAVLIAVSRVYVGVHYPSDVIVGAVCGTVFAVVVYALSSRFIKIPPPEKEETCDE